MPRVLKRPAAVLEPDEAIVTSEKLNEASSSAVDLSKLTMEQKIDLYSNEVKNQGSSSQDPRVLLRKYFSDKEMSAMWNRLQRKIKSQGSGQMKQKWSEVSNLKKGEGKNLTKSKCLSLSMTNPVEWQELWCREVERITQSEEKSVIKERLTRGELEVRHGYAEANRLIARGKWEATVDSDGDEVFVKSSRKDTQTIRHEKTAEIHGSNRLVDMEQAEKLREAMMMCFSEATVCMKQKPAVDNAVFKRPASGASASSFGSLLAHAPDTDDDDEEEEEPEDAQPPLTKEQKLVQDTEKARNECKKTITHLGHWSGKILCQLGKIKKKPLSQALRQKMAECRVELERNRTKIMKISIDGKAKLMDLKAGLQEAAKEAKTAADLLKMSKPFVAGGE